MKYLMILVLTTVFAFQPVVAIAAPSDPTFYAAEFGSGAAGAFAGLFIGLFLDNNGLAEQTGVAVGQSFGVTMGAMAGIVFHSMIQGYQGNLMGLALGVMAGQYASNIILSTLYFRQIHNEGLSPETYGVYVSIGALFGAIVLGMVGHHL